MEVEGIRYVAVASGIEAEANVESECNMDEVNLGEEWRML